MEEMYGSKFMLCVDGLKHLTCGVPQGSVLGPVMILSIFLIPIQSMTWPSKDADDMQLYTSLKLNGLNVHLTLWLTMLRVLTIILNRYCSKAYTVFPITASVLWLGSF